MMSSPISNLLNEVLRVTLLNLSDTHNLPKTLRTMEDRFMEKLLKICRDVIRPECRDMCSRSELWYQLEHTLKGIPMDHEK